ncbi:MAG: flagellar basal body-associated FliL family protein [Desulfobacterota bacterium]|jgi:flagellar basal body-associated protein FliL|nr:flagellar basal body-associated FliL family protein [Thermodesulfobacteriota bacterium]
MASQEKKTEMDLLKIDPQRVGGGGPEENGGPAANAGKGRSLLRRCAFLIYILAGMLIISGGIMASVLLGWITISASGGPAAQQSPAAGSTQAVQARPPEKPREMGPTVKLSPLIINLNEPAGSHFIKTSIVLELEKSDYLEEIQSRTAPLVDTAIALLGDQRLQDLLNPDYKDQLKKALTGKMNQRLRAQKIKQMYFDEFLYQ